MICCQISIFSCVELVADNDTLGQRESLPGQEEWKEISLCFGGLGSFVRENSLQSNLRVALA